ncbi:MAG: PulJ/GspJ family protein [Planctomycetota bacterium]
MKRRAFTLLEVVLALSLTIALMVVVLGVYRELLRARDDLADSAEQLGAQRRVMQRMTATLRTASGSMNGQPERVEFVRTAVPGRMAWAVPSSTDRPLPPEQDLRRVGYRLRRVEDEETGDLVVVGLERTTQKLLTAELVEEGEQIQTDLLTPHVKFLHLSYYDGGAGQTGWGGADLPQAVRITIGARPLPEELAPEEYPYEIFQRTVYLPASKQAAGADAAGGGMP